MSLDFVLLSAVRAWLRASVLGANDGILSAASLVLGVAAAHQEGETMRPQRNSAHRVHSSG